MSVSRIPTSLKLISKHFFSSEKICLKNSALSCHVVAWMCSHIEARWLIYVSELCDHWVQVMALHLFCTQPLPKPMVPYYEMNPNKQTSVKFQSKYKTFLRTKLNWKNVVCQNGSHFFFSGVNVLSMEGHPGWRWPISSPRLHWSWRGHSVLS